MKEGREYLAEVCRTTNWPIGDQDTRSTLWRRGIFSVITQKFVTRMASSTAAVLLRMHVYSILTDQLKLVFQPAAVKADRSHRISHSEDD